MSKNAIGLFCVAATLVIIGVWIAVGWYSPAPNKGDATLALAAITGGAVAIERILQVLWTGVDLSLGSSWPIKPAVDYVRNLEDKLSNTSTPFFQRAKTALDDLGNKSLQTQAATAKTELTKLEEELKKYQAYTQDNQLAKWIVATASARIDQLQAEYPALKEQLDLADEAVADLDAFAATFTDNPGRRLISIYMGVFLGLIGCGLLGLDVFQAVLGGATAPGFHVGVALTGVIIGLGSNPTHEVIQLLTDIKSKNRAQAVKAGSSSPVEGQPVGQGQFGSPLTR